MCYAHGALSSVIMIQNEYISIDIQTIARRLVGVVITDKVNGRRYELGKEIFTIQLQEALTDEACSKKEYTDTCLPLSTQDLMCGQLSIESIPAKPDARRLVERRSGQRATLPFAVTTDGYKLEWWIELRDGQPYLRLGLNITPMQFAMPARKITLLQVQAPEARIEGSVKGAPIVAAGNRLFAGVESPLSSGEVTKDGFSCSLLRNTHLPARTTSTISAVMGFCTPGQLRRTFQLSYLNEERARPYFPLFNYNTWYDIGYFSRYSEKDVMDTITLFGEELVRKRGVVMDSFLLDDGWDNTETLWQFHDELPNEFRDIRKLAESYGASPGVWFSPWGGYGQPKLNRLAAAGNSYETNERGFALSGPKYYELFREMCLHMIRENGANHFKLDGCSGMADPAPGSRFGSDFEAAISLIDELRTEKPDIYINLTTGTWASPFWFSIADSVWRGNWDHDFCGVGTARQQWITFRDAMIFAHNVKISPLFPINSLMTHGVIYNKGARGLMTTEGDDLADEIWSGLGLGTQMQEIYITPSMMKAHEWDTLAAAAKWTRKNASTMVDSHWVGGDPAALEVYGFASWSQEKGILILRNPSDAEQEFSFDAAAVFELPLGAPLLYELSSPKGDTLPQLASAGTSTVLHLKPFQVLVIEASPATR